MNKSAFFLMVAIISAFISGCSQKYKDLIETTRDTIAANQDATVTVQKIQKLPYASIFVRLNDDQKIFMVLAFADKVPENDVYQLKWLSSDKGLIVTEGGRIVKTSGLDKGDLVGFRFSDDQVTSNLLADFIKQDKQSESKAVYDWSPGYRYNFPANIGFRQKGVETVKTELWSTETNHVEEVVTFPSLMNKQYTNHYWLNGQGNIVKTIQYIGPNMDKLEIVFIKPAVVN